MQEELRRSIRVLRHKPTPARHDLSAADFGPWARGHYDITYFGNLFECTRARSEVASPPKIKEAHPKPRGTQGPSQRPTGRPRTPSARRSAPGLPGVLGHGLRQRGGATGSRGRSQNSRPKSSPSLAGGTGFSPISPADRTDRTRSPPAPRPSPLLCRSCPLPGTDCRTGNVQGCPQAGLLLPAAEEHVQIWRCGTRHAARRGGDTTLQHRATGPLGPGRAQLTSRRFVSGDRKSTRLNSSHAGLSRMPSSA